MNDTYDSAWCPICGQAAEVVQVSIEDGWSEAATHLVTIRACTNRHCERHHPAVRQKMHATTRPRSLSTISGPTIAATAMNSLWQFCIDSNQNCDVVA